MADLDAYAVALALLGALLTGLSKGGLPGVGNFSVLLFASVFDARASVGILLPVLCAADLAAITLYRREVAWVWILRLLPWMLVGIVLGWLVFAQLSNQQVRLTIGWIVLAMSALQLARAWWRRRLPPEAPDPLPHQLWFKAGMGLTGGCATMLANAAGPVGQLYFLSAGLPKMLFIGTSAWCFFIVNLIKLPFQAELGLLRADSFQVSLWLAPVAVGGVLIGRRLVPLIPQKPFEIAVWAFVLLAGIKLVWIS